MADTVLDVATDELKNAKDEQDRVGAELIDAQKDLDLAQKALDKAGVELKLLNEEAAAIRRKIAEEKFSQTVRSSSRISTRRRRRRARSRPRSSSSRKRSQRAR